MKIIKKKPNLFGFFNLIMYLCTMVDEEFKKYGEDNKDKLDLFRVINFVTSQKLKIGVSVSEPGIPQYTGLATIYGVYFDLDNLSENDEQLQCFIILHELAHYKSMSKDGKDKCISKLSEPDFDKFFNHVIDEEIKADRYASLCYKKLTGKTFPIWKTQQLNLPENQRRYEYVVRSIHKLNDGTEETYKKKLKEIFKIDV